MARKYKDTVILKKLGMRLVTSVFENAGDTESVHAVNGNYSRKNYIITGRFSVSSPDLPSEEIMTPVTIWPIEGKDVKSFSAVALEDKTSCYCVFPLLDRKLILEEVNVIAGETFIAEVGALYIVSVSSHINGQEKPEHSLVVTLYTPSTIVPSSDGKIISIKSS